MLSLVRSQPAAPAYDPTVTALAPALGRAYASLAHYPSAETSERLHEATVALVRRLKLDGVTPERVIVAIKQAIRRYGDCGTPLFLASEDVLHEGAHDAYRSAFHWALATYYEDATPSMSSKPNAG